MLKQKYMLINTDLLVLTSTFPVFKNTHHLDFEFHLLPDVNFACDVISDLHFAQELNPSLGKFKTITGLALTCIAKYFLFSSGARFFLTVPKKVINQFDSIDHYRISLT